MTAEFKPDPRPATDQCPDADQLPVLDQTVLDGLRTFGGGAVDVTERYVSLFLAEAATLFDRVQRASETHDLAAMERAAHTLLGAAGFIGAQRLAAAAGALEDALRAGAFDPHSGQLEALAAAYVEATTALRAIVRIAADHTD